MQLMLVAPNSKGKGASWSLDLGGVLGKNAFKYLKKAYKWVTGRDDFERAVERNPGQLDIAVAEAFGVNLNALKAQLRLLGNDPDAFFSSLEAVLGSKSVPALTDEELNRAFATAQNSSQNSSHLLWLIAGGVILLTMTGGGGRGGGRGRSRGRFRSRRRFRSRGRRRFR